MHAYIHIYIYIYIYICIWANYSDLTATSLESWLMRGIIPTWPYFWLGNYYKLPRYIIYIHICIYIIFMLMYGLMWLPSNEQRWKEWNCSSSRRRDIWGVFFWGFSRTPEGFKHVLAIPWTCFKDSLRKNTVVLGEKYHETHTYNELVSGTCSSETWTTTWHSYVYMEVS